MPKRKSYDVAIKQYKSKKKKIIYKKQKCKVIVVIKKNKIKVKMKNCETVEKSS